MLAWLRGWPEWESWQRWFLAIEILIISWEAPLLRSQPYDCKQHAKACESLKEPSSFIGYPFGYYVDWIERHHDVVIALGGLAVALFTFTLWRSTRALWRETRKGGDITERLAKAAEAQSILSQQLATAAENQVAILAAQTDIQNKEHAIGRLEFLARHRPRLRVRHVQLLIDPGMTYGSGAKVEGGLVVVNIGSTKAKIVDSRFLVLVATSLPSQQEFDGAPELLVRNHVMEIAESCSVPISLVFDAEFGDQIAGVRSIYVIGQIRYEDEAGAQRFMGFGRVRYPDGRFGYIDDPDYQYQD